MSADLEKIAQWYREAHGDNDIAQIIEGVAQISRLRRRPEKYFQIDYSDHAIATAMRYRLYTVGEARKYKATPKGTRKTPYRTDLFIADLFSRG